MDRVSRHARNVGRQLLLGPSETPMSVESANQSDDDGGVQNALTEIRASEAELQTFLDGLFDRLEGLADGLPVQEVARRQVQRETDRAALDDQIERLAALADELAESVAQHKRLSAVQNRT